MRDSVVAVVMGTAVVVVDGMLEVGSENDVFGRFHDFLAGVFRRILDDVRRDRVVPGVGGEAGEYRQRGNGDYLSRRKNRKIRISPGASGPVN